MVKKNPPPSLARRVGKYIREHGLLFHTQNLLVAVSGGPDSVCLLYTLYQLQGRLGITLHIAHLNHQLRGAEAEADARYVAELARKLNLPATIEKRDVAAYQKEHRLSLEEAAREVRYSFLAETARKVGTERVATGHTLNDQVETILLHIIRGTGTRGLRGLQAVQELQFSGQKLTVIRPLLEVKREETEECCADNHLAPCRDSSNQSFSLLRNRVRGELLPLLQSYNPGIIDSLLRISHIAEDDMAFIEEAGNRAFREIVQRTGDTLVFDKKQLKKLHPALQRQLLRLAIEGLLGTLKDIETRHIEEIREALEKPAGRQITLPEGLVFSVEYERYLLSLAPGETTPFPPLEGEYDIQIPGETRIPGWIIEAAVVPVKSYQPRQNGEQSGTLDSFVACFDKDKVGAKIKVRARKRGDRFQPLGLDREKKVGIFMVDARIPRAWRNRVPIICSPQQIIWVAGWRIDDRVKVTSSTREILCLNMKSNPRSPSASNLFRAR